MKKQKLLKLFEEVLERFESAEETVIYNMGDLDTTQLEKDIEKYRREFLEALED